jgi:hypothetical protein
VDTSVFFIYVTKGLKIDFLAIEVRRRTGRTLVFPPFAFFLGEPASGVPGVSLQVFVTN